MNTLLSQVRRRGVVRVVTAYAAIAFGIVQGADLMQTPLDLPEWLVRRLVIVSIAALPVVIVLAWLYPRPVAAGEADPEGDGRTGIARRHWWPLAAVLTAVSIIAIWSGFWLNAAAESGRLSGVRVEQNIIAVLPPTAKCSDDRATLCSGLNVLLTDAMRGTDPLQFKEPRDVERVTLHHIRAANAGMADQRAVARRLGAGRYIVPSVSEINERYRISATLNDVERAGESGPSAQAEGADLYAVVDSVASQLLAQAVDSRTSPHADLAMKTSHSLAALKAYLKGEKFARDGANDSAVVAFRNAVKLDSLFTLAWARLAIAMGWTEEASQSIEPIRQASLLDRRFPGRMPEREHMFIEALLARRAGYVDRSDSLYMELVSRDPSDAEAWVFLGGGILHGSWARGLRAGDAREAFEHALELYPDLWEAIDHLGWLEVAEGNLQKGDSLMRVEVTKFPHNVFAVPIGSYLDLVHGTPAERDSAFRRLQYASPFMVSIAYGPADMVVQRLQVSEEIVRLLTAGHRTASVRAGAYTDVAYILLAEGRPLAAAAHLDSADLAVAGTSLIARSWIALNPQYPPPSADIARLRSRLNACWKNSDASASDGRHEMECAYLDGALGIRIVGPDAATPAFAWLSSPRADTTMSRIGRHYADRLRLHVLSAQGKFDEALQLIESGPPVGSGELMAQLSHGYDRFARAELLEKAGRSAEAVAWYHGASRLNMQDLPMLAPSVIREAQLLIQMGNARQAAALIDKLRDDWADAEPGARAVLEYQLRTASTRNMEK